MKQFKFFMASAILTVAFAGATPVFAAPAASEPQQTSIVDKVPANLTVKQSAVLSDGRHVTVYYRKAGDVVEIYSNDNLKGYKADDLLALKNTELTVVSGVEGKLVYKCPVTKARAILKRLVNRVL